MSMLFSKRPHTLAVQFVEGIHSDVGKLLEDYEEDFVWLDEILDACKKALVTPEVQLLPKTPSSKKSRRRIIKKPPPEIFDSSESEAEDECVTPPSRRTRQTRQKKGQATSQGTRSTRDKKQSNDSMEAPRIKISPKATSTNLSKMSDCSELELSESEMTPVAQIRSSKKLSFEKIPAETPKTTNKKLSPVMLASSKQTSSVKQRASAYEHMIRTRSNSPKAGKRTPINDKSNSSISVTTPDIMNTPDTVIHNKTSSCLAGRRDSHLNGSFIKERPAQKRRSSRKSLKVLASKVKRHSAHNHCFSRQIETYSSEESEEVTEPKSKPRTRLRLKKKETVSTEASREESEMTSTCNESDDTDVDMIMKELIPVTPVPKPRTSKPTTPQTSLNKSDDTASNRDVPAAVIESDVPMIARPSNEGIEKVPMDTNSVCQKDSPNRDRDSGISGVLSNQSSAVSLKNLDCSEVEKNGTSGGVPGRSTRSQSKMFLPSPIVETSDTEEQKTTRTNRKRHVDECNQDSPDPKRSCIDKSIDLEKESDIEVKTPTDNVYENTDSDQYESMENDSDDYTSPKYPSNKIVQPVSKNSVTRPNRPNNLLSGASFMSSFMQRNTPVKPTKMTMDQKKKEILEKEKKNEHRLQRTREMKNRQIEEQKRLRQERMKRAEKLRLEQDRSQQINRNNNVKKMEERLNLQDKIKEEKFQKERLVKQSLRHQKMKEAEDRRKQDEEERLRKKFEQEEDDWKQRELLQKKKEQEDQERQKRLAEEKQKHEEKMAKFEKERQLEKEKLLQVELEREKEHHRLKEERDKQYAKEKAERERLELDKKKEREAQIQKELVKLREMEKARLVKLAAEKEEQQREKERIQKIVEKNQAATSKPALNITHNTSDNQSHSNPNSYEITPGKKKVKNNSNTQDYNINDLHSEDSTDDEDAPRKKIPVWAQGTNLKAALINQEYHPPNLDEIFSVVPDLDLNDVFIQRKPRFNRRTSSAVWDSPILKPCQSAQFHI